MSSDPSIPTPPAAESAPVAPVAPAPPAASADGKGCPRPTVFRFERLAADPGSRARLGRLHTARGVIDTPAFMPVGTRASVKGVLPGQVRETGAQILLANTFHLLLRPGPELVRSMGGVSRWMNWHGPVLTDSGGYQVFSLGFPRRDSDGAADAGALRKIDDDGVTFRSPVDGSYVRMTPESSMAVQNALGADIIMAFDECPPHPCPPEQLRRAVERTIRWTGRCVAHQARLAESEGNAQALFAITQGGLDAGLRRECAARLGELDCPGYALGGLSVGEPHAQMVELLERVADELPADRPRYLMGVGMPLDVVEAVRCGIDMFDCVLPTRNGRNAFAFTAKGPVRLRNERYRTDTAPLDPDCRCPACAAPGFSRSYLRHLFMTDEMLGPILVTLHNLHYYQGLMAGLRAALREGGGRFAAVAAGVRAAWS
jgi:queuine tRNA-ribosyltransferase